MAPRHDSHRGGPPALGGRGARRRFQRQFGADSPQVTDVLTAGIAKREVRLDGVAFVSTQQAVAVGLEQLVVEMGRMRGGQRRAQFPSRVQARQPVRAAFGAPGEMGVDREQFGRRQITLAIAAESVTGRMVRHRHSL